MFEVDSDKDIEEWMNAVPAYVTFLDNGSDNEKISSSTLVRTGIITKPTMDTVDELSQPSTLR